MICKKCRSIERVKRLKAKTLRLQGHRGWGELLMDMWDWWYEYMLFKKWRFPLKTSLFFVQWYDITQWLSMSVFLIFNLTHFLWDSEWIIFDRRYYCKKVCLNSGKKIIGGAKWLFSPKNVFNWRPSCFTIYFIINLVANPGEKIFNLEEWVYFFLL